jgi:hypothetical protein
MQAHTTRTGRSAIALVAALAAFALPTAALAHDHAEDGPRPGAGAVEPGDDRGQRGESRPDRVGGTASAVDDRPQRGRGRGPSAAQVASALGLEIATVRSAMRTAHEQVRDVAGKAERRAAFQAALAAQLGLTQAAVDAAFDAIRADTLSACVDRLLARGVVTQAQADAIDAQIAAGELDAAHAAITAAKQAARTADRS